MACNRLLSWAVLLLSCESLLAHPVTGSADVPYTGPGGEEGPEDQSLGDISSLLQRALGQSYSSPLTREPNMDDYRVPYQGLGVAALFPKAGLKEVLLDTPSHLSPLSYLLGARRPYRKRGSGADCFWKYCV